VIDGRVLFRVRGVTAFPADARATAIASRVRTLAADQATPPAALRLVASENSTDIIADDNAIMSVFDADARAEAPGLTRQALAQIYLNRNFLFDFANTRFVLPYPTQRQVAIRLAIATGSGLRR
jgi:hypothetical protein